MSNGFQVHGSGEDLLALVAKVFENRYGMPPEAAFSAPGRVNLMGEHTDYNGGFVLPMPLELEVAVALGRGTEPGLVELYSSNFDDAQQRRIDEDAAGQWSDYVLGCLRAAHREPAAKAGCRVAVAATLPTGAGISSSAALEVATLRAIAHVSGQTLEAAELARLARSVECNFVGMPCGIMDQFAAAAGSRGKAVFLDTRSLDFETVPLLPGHRFVVVHSGVRHQLTDDAYATRVAECEAACAALGVGELRDLEAADLWRIGKLEPPLNRRARHVVTENRRVLDAVDAMKTGDAARFGFLMQESHASQREDYEVSVPEVDALVDGAMEAGAIGARLTGGGFGGSIVALVKAADADGWCHALEENFSSARVLAVT